MVERIATIFTVCKFAQLRVTNFLQFADLHNSDCDMLFLICSWHSKFERSRSVQGILGAVEAGCWGHYKCGNVWRSSRIHGRYTTQLMPQTWSESNAMQYNSIPFTRTQTAVIAPPAHAQRVMEPQSQMHSRGSSPIFHCLFQLSVYFIASTSPTLAGSAVGAWYMCGANKGKLMLLVVTIDF